jgi:hypothetical protein
MDIDFARVQFVCFASVIRHGVRLEGLIKGLMTLLAGQVKEFKGFLTRRERDPDALNVP